jgi:Na+-translocating ferredoxin:NAD+ oxidoreductase subunit B
MSKETAEQIDALLPQTQCTKCGYAGCRPYAEAIAHGEAGINQCPPGGKAVVGALAALLRIPYQPLDPTHGVEQPRSAAFIREELCIGCMLCIEACPVDAIVGAAKLMHTVLIDACTGCELCVPPCPVDCIDMLSLTELARLGSTSAARELAIPVAAHARAWRARYASHLSRRARQRQERDARLAAKAAGSVHSPQAPGPGETRQRKQAAIAAALERARARRAGAG